MANARASVADAPQVKGTTPDGATSEAEASKRVREMFTEIAPTYDRINHILSVQIDRIWRARTAKLLSAILQRPEANILDLCCGTGDLSFSLAKSSKAKITGADFAHTMLVRARQKSAAYSKTGGGPLIPFLEADALNLPFAENTFDLVTTAFGFRNLANYEAGLVEIRRILKPGGTIAILEFTEPPPGVLGDLYRWYFFKILPRIGGFLSGHKAAYTYLPKSISRFLRPRALVELMGRVGFNETAARVWTFGTVALHTGIKGGQG